MPALPTVAGLLEICSSGTMAEAASRGDRLGWQRQGGSRMEEWRAGFIRHNGGTVDVIGWRRGGEGEATLSFWIARGPNAHRACYLSVPDATGLLKAFSDALGRPGSLDEAGDIVSASWTQGPAEIQFAGVGAGAVVNIARHDR